MKEEREHVGADSSRHKGQPGVRTGDFGRIESGGETRQKVRGTDISGNEGRGTENFESEDKDFVPDKGVYWKPVEGDENNRLE